MNVYDLLPGDRLLTKKGVVTHSGTYMGSGMVAHISPRKHLAVERVADFSDGQIPRVISNGGIEEKRLWDGVEQCKKRPYYSAFSNNCEDISNFLETGVRKSPQRTGAALGGLGGYATVKALDIKNPYAACSIVIGGALLGMALNKPKRCD